MDILFKKMILFIKRWLIGVNRTKFVIWTVPCAILIVEVVKSYRDSHILLTSFLIVIFTILFLLNSLIYYLQNTDNNLIEIIAVIVAVILFIASLIDVVLLLTGSAINDLFFKWK